MQNVEYITKRQLLGDVLVATAISVDPADDPSRVQDGERQEQTVKDNHGEAEPLCHPPTAHRDDDHDRDEHEDQEEQRKVERVADDVDALAAFDYRPEKPGQRQAEGDVEDVAPDGGAHRHVWFTATSTPNQYPGLPTRPRGGNIGLLGPKAGDLHIEPNGCRLEVTVGFAWRPSGPLNRCNCGRLIAVGAWTTR